MSKNRDRTKGLPYPVPVDPGEYIYMCLPVPNNTLYRQALYGVLSELGKPWTWQQTTGTDNEGAYQAAEVWRKAVSLSIYTDECGGVVDCSAIANCIENNAATRTLIQQIVNSTTQPQTIGYPGQPMTTAQANTPINPVPDGCNKDEFWAQCQQFVEYFTQAGTDLIEKIEVYSNAVEGAAFIEMAPVLGTIVDEVQIDQFLDFIDWAIEIVGEVYAADLTQTVKDEIACAYFCAGFDDCQLTIERVWQVHNERLGGILVPSSIDSVEDLISAMVTLATNPGLAVDSWLAFLAGMAKLASYLGVRGIDQTLAITLKLAMNDANDDWQILCEDCAPDTPNISFIGTFAPSYDGSPQTFIGNTPTGGSIWDLTFQNISGTIAVAVTAVNAASNPICVLITSTTNVVSYQHNLCSGGAETGTTENPTTEYGPNLGWFGAAGGTVMRVTVEPV